jgi:hypothetical protein
MNISKNKNPKIPYPPEVKGYTSSRILKEILLDYLTQENIQPIKQIDNNVRSAILRLKEFLIKVKENKFYIKKNYCFFFSN